MTLPKAYRSWLARCKAAHRNAAIDRRNAEDEVRHQVEAYLDWAAAHGLDHVTVYPASKSGAAFSDVARQVCRRRCWPTEEWSPEMTREPARLFVHVCNIDFALAEEDARSGSHPGPCDADVLALSAVPYIREQLDQINPEILACGLSEYGAWDAEDLADHEQNLQRFLWLACGDAIDDLEAAA